MHVHVYTADQHAVSYFWGEHCVYIYIYIPGVFNIHVHLYSTIRLLLLLHVHLTHNRCTLYMQTLRSAKIPRDALRVRGKLMLFRYSFSTQLCSTACVMSLEQNVQKHVHNNRQAMITTSLLDASTIDLLLHKKQKREAKAIIDTS